MPWALLVWAIVVIISMLIVVVLASRWGRDPFGFALLAAVLGPIAIIALVGTHQSDRQRPHRFEGESPSPGSSRGNVIVAADGSDGSTRAAAAVPGLGFPGAEAIVFTALPRESQLRDDAPAPARQQHQREIDRLTGGALKALNNAGIPSRVLVGYGAPGEEIVEAARVEGARAVIVGRRGAGVSKALLGSVSDHVVKHASVPVVVID